MRFGVASIRVTGMDLPSSVNTRLMPALRPTIPSEYFFAVMSMASGQLDLDVDAGRELELHQRVHGLVIGVDDVEHALVRAGFILVARVLVDVRRSQDGVALDLGRQRDRAAHLRTGPARGLDDLAGRTVDQAMIEGLEPDPDLLVRHETKFLYWKSAHECAGFCEGLAGFKERRASRLGARNPVESTTFRADPASPGVSLEKNQGRPVTRPAQTENCKRDKSPLP